MWVKRNAQSMRGTRTVPALCSCMSSALGWQKQNKERQALIQTSIQEGRASPLSGGLPSLSVPGAFSAWQRHPGAAPPCVFCVSPCHTHRHMDKRLWKQETGDATCISPLPLFLFLWTLFSMTETSTLHLIFSTLPSTWRKGSSVFLLKINRIMYFSVILSSKLTEPVVLRCCQNINF